ncbi:unnamed protein product [Ceratitis capitata]|uniref:(Mediterranean fruit fly) hypothetical protein n=1 Tax=Ceratitis capitata TaxID=7213 RepID=A0A811UUX6_CERCA|nr:unnamed protein product [Ceratitis capitata]
MRRIAIIREIATDNRRQQDQWHGAETAMKYCMEYAAECMRTFGTQWRKFEFSQYTKAKNIDVDVTVTNRPHEMDTCCHVEILRVTAGWWRWVFKQTQLEPLMVTADM